MDPVVCVHAGERRLVLEQDGFLRQYDMATVLWPAGYFLTQWVVRNCAKLDNGRRILELGAGIGAPSIAASLCGDNVVLATDKEGYSLVNMQVNAQVNGASSMGTARLDWLNDSDITAALSHGPFDVILGAGLAPHRWTEREWQMLKRLLNVKTGIIVLCHGTEDVSLTDGVVAGGAFALEEHIHGDAYGLQTRWGHSSEFEIIVLKPSSARSNDEL
eukprot:TRINITY_DN1534_c1_g1_i1.p1 TRINITY_DN1534_c1_g1~~TRINITY_DN1534_c1_g1_i1.p1  ORF type:complete len:217 (+),score=48.81 TRINITY_DN1534_c1_g1_i1:508-1158(+)